MVARKCVIMPACAQACHSLQVWRHSACMPMLHNKATHLLLQALPDDTVQSGWCDLRCQLFEHGMAAGRLWSC
jgi:hypothetical protein